MTVSIDGTDIGTILEVASIVGTIVAMLVIGLLVYLMVRPPRHVREARRRERSPHSEIATEQIVALLDRMEQRLATLERVVADGDEEQPKVLERAERPDEGRMS